MFSVEQDIEVCDISPKHRQLGSAPQCSELAACSFKRGFVMIFLVAPDKLLLTFTHFMAQM